MILVLNNPNLFEDYLPILLSHCSDNTNIVLTTPSKTKKNSDYNQTYQFLKENDIEVFSHDSPNVEPIFKAVCEENKKLNFGNLKNNFCKYFVLGKEQHPFRGKYFIQ